MTLLEIWPQVEYLKNQERRLLEILRGMEAELAEKVGKKEFMPIAMTELRRGRPIKVIYIEDKIVGYTTEDQEGEDRLAYYHIERAEPVPTQIRERINVLTDIAQRIAMVAVSKGLDPKEEIRKMMSRMLGQHPLAKIALMNAKLDVEPDNAYFLGWLLEEKKKVEVARVNVIIVSGYECPFSRRYKEMILDNMNQLLNLGICPMLLEEEEKVRVGTTWGGTPVTIVADEYFRKIGEYMGMLSFDRVLEVTNI